MKRHVDSLTCRKGVSRKTFLPPSGALKIEHDVTLRILNLTSSRSIEHGFPFQVQCSGDCFSLLIPWSFAEFPEVQSVP
jgi:hypothetical protein